MCACECVCVCMCACVCMDVLVCAAFGSLLPRLVVSQTFTTYRGCNKKTKKKPTTTRPSGLHSQAGVVILSSDVEVSS